MATNRDVGRGSTTVRDRLATTLLRHPNALPLALVTVAVLAANGPAIVHLVTTNPLQLFGDLPQHGTTHGVLSGQPTIDPNAGGVTQAEGALVAHDWLSGHLPWWNPFAGFGEPLAGSYQSAAFFPLTVLFAGGADGALWFHVILELIAGWSTFFLMRRFTRSRTAATTAAVAFGLCGTFAWLANAIVNPVAFLPLALLGVEWCRDAARRDRTSGWVLLAPALALSILAGFPEVAYLNGLFLAWWALIRLVTLPRARLRYCVNLLVGLVVAVGIAAPVEVAFGTYLRHANVGPHAGVVGSQAEPAHGLAQLVLPYVFGPIFALRSASPPPILTEIWGTAGGYLSAALITCAVIGLFGRRHRPLRVGLAVWIALAVAKTFGLAPIASLVTHWPGLHDVATARYITTSYEMAVVVLAALGVDDLARRSARPWAVIGGGAAGVALVAAAAASAWTLLEHVTGTTHPHRPVLANAAWALVAVAAITAAGLLALRGRGRLPTWSWRAAGGVVALDAVLLFAVPLLSAPPPASLQLGAVRFLQDHVGTARFATLGPIQPNYGSYFDVNEGFLHDLPVPKAYGVYASRHLDPTAQPWQITGVTRVSQNVPGPGAELSAHLDGFEQAGIRYIVVSSNDRDVFAEPWPPPRLRPQVRLVYHDPHIHIYELPHARPFFTTPGVACTVRAVHPNSLVTDCPRSASLVRLEQYLPGWTAEVNGHATKVRPADGPFQAVTVPAGRSTVSFSFTPPHGAAAVAVSTGSLVVLGGGVLVHRRRRSRPRHARHGRHRRAAGPAPVDGAEEHDTRAAVAAR